jgi:hypothetical protein
LTAQWNAIRNSWWQNFKEAVNKCFAIDNTVEGWGSIRGDIGITAGLSKNLVKNHYACGVVDGMLLKKIDQFRKDEAVTKLLREINTITKK